MRRFEKLDHDIQFLIDKMLEDEDLCKLIHYPDKYPLSKPSLNWEKHLYDKRLFSLRNKMPLAAKEGSYILVRIPNYRSSKGGHYISSMLLFDVYCHVNTKTVYDNEGNRRDRALMIIDRIESIMENLGIGIGEDNLNGGGEVSNQDGTFQGCSVGYVNVDFRKTSR